MLVLCNRYGLPMAARTLGEFQGASEAPVCVVILAERATRKFAKRTAARRVELKMVSHTCYTTLESVNDPRFSGIVRRHLHPHAITHGQANEAFAHFAGNMREHEMIVWQCNPKHRPGQHTCDRSFDRNRFF